MCGKLCTCAINHRGMTFHWRLVDSTWSPEEHVWDDVHCYTFVNGTWTNKQHWHCFLTISFYKNKLINIEQQHQKNNYATLAVDTALHLYIIYTSLYIINMSALYYWNVCFGTPNISCTRTHTHKHTLALRMIWAFTRAASSSRWSGLDNQRCRSAVRELRAVSVGHNMVNGWWLSIAKTGSNPTS